MKKYASAVSFLIIITAIYLSFSSLMPKKISDNTTSLTQFSTERALVHLKEISKKPHFVGTIEHKKVQDYIVAELQKLGLKTEIQQQVALNKKWRAGTTAQNIIAKIEGSSNSKALLLLTHYDSAVHSSLGASDAGSGVVTILEGLRAFLAKNKNPKNDIIILLSDAEELGLLGANAFVNHHPWAKNVGLVLNFESRGSGGPSYMLMETNGGNKKLIEQFSKANPKYPVASSLMYSIYKMLPNDTDLTVFREDGSIQGFNFAFIDDHFDYHTQLDSYERLDRNTLEHQASYLMPMLDYFADADLENLESNDDNVYFNLPFVGMVFYPFSWVLPIIIICLILFVVLLIFGIAKKKINTPQILKGFVPFLSSLIIGGLIAFFGWKLLLKIHPQYQDILHGFTYNGHWYIAAFSALTLAICFIIYKKFLKRDEAINLMVAPIFIWILINIAIAFYLKGAGYFIISVIYGLIVLALLIFSKKENSSILLSLLSIPVLFVFAPLVQMFPIGLGLRILAVSSVFIVLLFGLLLPIFSSFKNIKNLGKLFLALAVLIFIMASLNSGYTIDRKKPNSIIYVLDADKNKAYWASYNNKIDEFTKQFLSENPIKGGFDNSTTASKYGSRVQLHKQTEVKTIIQPQIEILKDTIIGDDRHVDLSITPQRLVNRIEFISKNPIVFTSFKINGETLKKEIDKNYVFYLRESGQTVFSYYFSNLDKNMDIEFAIPSGPSPSFYLYETSYDLFENMAFDITPRTETMMPMPFVINDAIIIKKQINLD
ncbi:M28 family peptidase [Aureibaculum sp. 2210JD6-5]|uniref:M28 family peptidase n=1 Tax=Aureibaculum sp. 2210JD6-5 TaxID=3103957 RepID=UPI002AAE71A4|nr:M28 family peptidase [Aureibaculum sp. 2210JD6-5]MDY7395907.1 M28 family peptidase [Aureibaculum sp. 2210JD6-5]